MNYHYEINTLILEPHISIVNYPDGSQPTGATKTYNMRHKGGREHKKWGTTGPQGGPKVKNQRSKRKEVRGNS